MFFSSGLAPHLGLQKSVLLTAQDFSLDKVDDSSALQRVPLSGRPRPLCDVKGIRLFCGCDGKKICCKDKAAEMYKPPKRFRPPEYYGKNLCAVSFKSSLSCICLELMDLVLKQQTEPS